MSDNRVNGRVELQKSFPSGVSLQVNSSSILATYEGKGTYMTLTLGSATIHDNNSDRNIVDIITASNSSTPSNSYHTYMLSITMDLTVVSV